MYIVYIETAIQPHNIFDINIGVSIVLFRIIHKPKTRIYTFFKTINSLLRRIYRHTRAIAAEKLFISYKIMLTIMSK